MKYTEIKAEAQEKISALSFEKGMKQIEAWQKAEVKKDKAEQEQAILYELNNYECFYTGDTSDAMPVLKDLGFTEKQVNAVYHKNREFALN